MAHSHEELLSLDVAAAAERLKAKDISPVELTEAYLDRIARTDEKLRAYITVTADLARKTARKAEHEIVQGKWRGPFHGIPIGLKDLCCTKGIRTTAGSKILRDFTPDYDCTVWTRLAKAGAILLGKLNMHEFAYGITSSNPHWGYARNPYDTERIPGGSSGGSAAAIVARSAAATIGSDTGGSIRIPATLCGCVGLKPTWSRVSRYGVIPLSSSMDHMGPITRTVRDAALMLQVIAGHDRNDSTSSREKVPDYSEHLESAMSGMRIGIIRELNDGLCADARASFDAAQGQLRKLGATIDEVSIPSLPLAAFVNGAIIRAEAFEYHESWLLERREDYGEDVRRLLESGMLATAASYVRAQRARARMVAEALGALDGRDVLIAPAAAIPAYKIGTGQSIDEPEGAVDPQTSILRFTMPFDVTGQPALALPTGLSSEGLPLAMQIVGRPFDEAKVLQVGAAYERARGALPVPRAV